MILIELEQDIQPEPIISENRGIYYWLCTISSAVISACIIACMIIRPLPSFIKAQQFISKLQALVNFPNSVIETGNFDSPEAGYSPQLRAFLTTIRWSETGYIGKESYRQLVFHGEFNNFVAHPLIKQCAPINDNNVCSTAAGAYQIMDYEWRELEPKLNLPDFSPASQDKMAVFLIERNHALEDVEAGNFDKAACEVGKVWASFPCNDYDQHPRTFEQLRDVYLQQLKFYREQSWGSKYITFR